VNQILKENEEGISWMRKILRLKERIRSKKLSKII